MKLHKFIAILVLVVMVCTTFGSAQASILSTPAVPPSGPVQPPAERKPLDQISPEMAERLALQNPPSQLEKNRAVGIAPGVQEPGVLAGARQDINGLWFMDRGKIDAPAQAQAQAVAQPITGGPDEFGYYWLTDGGTYHDWAPVTSGTRTSIGEGVESVGPVQLPFAFNFYENSYTQIYISKYGFISFSSDALNDSQSRIPNSAQPNNVIAPYWAPMVAGEMGYGGAVYYSSGNLYGTPYFAVQWDQVHDAYTPGESSYTFQVLLFSDGRITFNYDVMKFPDTSQFGYFCGMAGIEDSSGEIGLSYGEYCQVYPGYHWLEYNRPQPSARSRVKPERSGAFTSAGQTTTFDFSVRNFGDMGPDTFEIEPWAWTAGWDYSIVRADGSPLANSNGSYGVDTGSLSQGSTFYGKVRLTANAGAAVGDTGLLAFNICSTRNVNYLSVCKKVEFKAAVPAPFIQADIVDFSGSVDFRMIQPIGTRNRPFNTWSYNPSSPGVARLGNGNYAYVWNDGYYCGSDCSVEVQPALYSILNDSGTVIRYPSAVKDLWNETQTTYDWSPVVAASPDEGFVIAWREMIYNSANQFNMNVYASFYASSGDLLVGPVNLTNNTTWRYWDTTYADYYYNVRIASNPGKRYIVTWGREQYTGSDYDNDIFYAVLNGGGVVKDKTALPDTLGPDVDYYEASPAGFKDSSDGTPQFMVAYIPSNLSDIFYDVIDNNGNRRFTGRISWDEQRVYDYGQIDLVSPFDGWIAAAWTAETPPPGETSWTAEFFNNINLQGTPVLVRADPTLHYQWDDRSPADGVVDSDNFSVRWTSDVTLEEGVYTFDMWADDFSRLYIDGILKIDNWSDQVCCRETAVTLQLGGGTHQVKMEMSELTGWASARLDWHGANDPDEVVRYTILDPITGAYYEPMRVPSDQMGKSATSLSITNDPSGNTILTWLDDASQPNSLYYALLNPNDHLSGPVIFQQGDQPGSTYELGYSGNQTAPYPPAPRALIEPYSQQGEVVFNGSTIYGITVINTGNNPESIELQSSDDRAHFYVDNGFTPLTDTNSNGPVDTGVMAPGESRIIKVKALPDPSLLLGDGWNITLNASPASAMSKFSDAYLWTTVVAPYSLSLPMVSTNKFAYFEGPNEQEDNDTFAQANGPLRSGTIYTGQPNDIYDIYWINVPASGRITIDLTNMTADLPQIQLYKDKSMVVYDGKEPYHLEYDASPGKYYIVVGLHSVTAASSSYHLTVSYPQ